MGGSISPNTLKYSILPQAAKQEHYLDRDHLFQPERENLMKKGSL